MAYNRIQAGRLLAAAELPVFEASLGEPLAALTAAKLRVLIKRARTMRDKAQDLLQRQRVATRGRTGSKGGTSGAANERTAQKARALNEALTRFEHRLAQLEAAGELSASATLRAGERLATQKQRARASHQGCGRWPRQGSAGVGPQGHPEDRRRIACSSPECVAPRDRQDHRPDLIAERGEGGRRGRAGHEGTDCRPGPGAQRQGPGHRPGARRHRGAFGQQRRRCQGHAATAQVHRQPGHPGPCRCAWSPRAGQARQALSNTPSRAGASIAPSCNASKSTRNPQLLLERGVAAVPTTVTRWCAASTT